MRKTSILPNAGPDTSDFPFGSIIDDEGAVIGTPVIEGTYSDFIQSLWHFFTKSGMSPNGLKENTTNGFQLYEAIERVLSPVGIIKIWAGSYDTIPDGWLSCAGQILDNTLYPELFSKIGYTYGGSGVNFYAPDLKGRFPLGNDGIVGSFPVGKKDGEKDHTLLISEIPSHDHVQTVYKANSNGGNIPAGYTNVDGNVTSNYRTSLTGGGTAHNNMPPYLSLTFIIKVKYGAGL